MGNKMFNRRPRMLRTLLILLFITVPLSHTMAQLNLSTPRASLGTVIKQIQAQSEYQFFYSDKLSAVTVEAVNVKNASLEVVLSSLLKGTNIAYKVEENIVYLSEKETPVNTQAPEQSRTVSGTVIDGYGEPLIGVSILIKGTQNGTITNMDGEYKLEVSGSSPILVFSYIGYNSQEASVSGKSVIDITMKENTEMIEEVVVTALGIKRSQKALSYNVQQVSEDEFLRNKDANFINALSGKVAGVTINSSSSGVGGASKVVMRGAKSISKSDNALYVIDGIPLYNFESEGGTEHSSKGARESISDLNPEDIESMSVLTGAAAAALYGSDATNGAILITTKKGAAGKLSLTVSQNTEFIRPFVLPKFQNRYGTGSALNPNDTEHSWGSRLNESNYMGYSPRRDYFERGLVTTESISLSTGTDKNQTYASASILNSDGMIPNNDYNRYNFTVRNTTFFLKDKMTLDIGASYIKQDDRNMTNQGTYSNPIVTAYLFPRGDDWNSIRMYELYDSQRKIHTQNWTQSINEFTGQNPYWINYRNLRVNKKNRYMMNAYLTYQVVDWLSLAGRVRMDNSNNNYTEKLYATTNTTLTEGSNNGYYGVSKTEDQQTYADFMVNINKMFWDDKLSVQANIGASYNDRRQDILENRGPIDELSGLANFFTVSHLDKMKAKRIQKGYREQQQAVFASLELGYKSAYYLTVTGRNEWPSQLAGPNSAKKSYFYPSVGGSFVLSEIFDLPEFISFMKLRTSFASVASPFSRFLANPTYPWNDPTYQWEITSNYPMYKLKPERTDSWEIGLNVRFWHKFNLDISLYSTDTKNQTFDPELSASSGYDKWFLQTGKVRNQGIELSLGYENSWKNDFRWSSNYTFSANKNKIKKLVTDIMLDNGVIVNQDEFDVNGLGQARFILKKGGTLGDLYSLSDLQRDENGYIYVNEEGKVSVNNNVGQIKLGSVFPKANMAWRNDFSWKGIQLGFMISARLGGITYSATQAALDLYGVSEESAIARDQGGALINGNDRVDAETWYSTIGANNGIPQFYTYSATNVRLQEASIGYTIPKSKLWNIGDVTVSLIGRNLWMIYCKAPYDPDAVATTGSFYQGINNFMLPSTRNLGFNVRLKF